jgi:Bacterial Ig domain/HYR domain/Secretion system C-terminal sorting domain
MSYLLLAMLLWAGPLSMQQAFGTNPTNKTIVAGCDGVTIVGGGGTISVAGLGSYSHVIVFTPGFASIVYDQQISAASVIVPVAAGSYVVKIWSNPDPASPCENNFPVTVGGAAAPPVAVNDNATTPQSTPVSVPVLTNDNVNGNLQSLVVASNPANGTAVVNGNNIVYTPNAGFSGTDAFTYTISNGNGTSTATVTVTVPAGGGGGNCATIAGGSGSITVSGITSGCAMVQIFTAAWVPVSTQQVTGTTATISNIAAGSYIVKASVLGAGCTYPIVCEAQATVTVTGGGGTAPTAVNDASTTPQNTPVSIAVLGNDNINGTLQALVVMSNPANGTAVVNGNNIVYTPRAGFCGNDVFTYKILNNSNLSAIATVNVSVTCPVANPPVAVNDNSSTAQNTPVSISVLGNDNVNGTLQSLVIASNPLNGTAVVNGNNIIYTPNAGFSGNDVFTYTISNGNGTSTATVNVNVAAPALGPVASNDNAVTNQNTGVNISILNNDNLNGAALTSLTITTNPANGTAVVNGNSILYTPRAGFCGNDAFVYRITTANGSSSATANITVNCPVDPCATDAIAPVLVNCPANIVKNLTAGVSCATVNFTAPTATDNCTTPTVTQIAGPANGACLVAGNYTVTYKATDAKGNSVTCSFTITVNAYVNPCANDVTPPVITCPANMSKTPTNGGTCWTNFTWNAATATDNCSTPTVVQVSGPTSGSCIGYGVSTVCYKATDAKGNSSTCTFTVTVNKPACTMVFCEFKNNTSCQLYLYCVNSNGSKTWHATLNSGYWCSRTCAPGTRWLMCTSNGSVISDYTCTSECNQYVTPTTCKTGSWLAGNAVLYLEAKAELNRNHLEFVNNTSDVNDYFTVEKVNPATGDFEKLEIVNNKRSTNDTELYTTYDNAPSEGDNTYRVKVTYLDGTSKISAPQTVSFKGVEGVRMFPNPAVDVIGVDLSKYKGQAVTIALYNQFGQQVLTQQIDKAAGTVNVDVSQNATGNYLMRVVSKGRKDVIQQVHIAK